jgi:hypothetical protein
LASIIAEPGPSGTIPRPTGAQHLQHTAHRDRYRHEERPHTQKRHMRIVVILTLFSESVLRWRVCTEPLSSGRAAAFFLPKTSLIAMLEHERFQDVFKMQTYRPGDWISGNSRPSLQRQDIKYIYCRRRHRQSTRLSRNAIPLPLRY